MQNGIELECLPPHTTTILQPLDVVTLKKVKTAWRSLLVDHNTKTNSAPTHKQEFALLISELWKNHLLKGHCSGGFAKAGIYPFDPRAVSKEKLLGPSPIVSSNNELVCIDDSAVIHQPTHRFIRSASCDQLSTMALNLTTTPLLNISNQSISMANDLSTMTTTMDHIGMSSTTLPITTDSSSKLLHGIDCFIYTDDIPYHELTVRSSTVDSTITTQYSSVPNNSSYDVPVFADISNNNVAVMNDSLYSVQAPIDVLSNVIHQYMTTSTTNTSSNVRKKMIDRNSGQSLTSVEVLAQLQNKEKLKQRKVKASTKKTTTSGIKRKR
ncbi:unnamed protein product, partial [Rotaria sordida]